MGRRGRRIGNVTFLVVDAKSLFDCFHLCFVHWVPVAFAEIRPSQPALPLLSSFVEVGAFYAATRGFDGGAVDAASLEKELVSLAFHVVAGLPEPELKLDP